MDKREVKVLLLIYSGPKQHFESLALIQSTEIYRRGCSTFICCDWPWIYFLLSLYFCFACLVFSSVCIYLFEVKKKKKSSSFLLQCVCGRWTWPCPRAASRWHGARQPSCRVPSPPALPSTTSTLSGWWSRCPMLTSQNRYKSLANIRLLASEVFIMWEDTLVGTWEVWGSSPRKKI